MTKKDFKERCSFHVYSGNGSKTNAIFFDWQDTDQARGFKYGVAANTKNCTKAELFDYIYYWVIMEEHLPYYIRYKYAETDEKRFKTPLSLNF